MKTSEITLVLGGCRSGKSHYALAQAQRFIGKRNLFIATCVPGDSEMKARVARHQAERNEAWQTMEVPVDLAPAIADQGHHSNVILVDCLTLWIANLCGQTDRQADIDGHVNQLTAVLATAACPVILVSNEVGGGGMDESGRGSCFRPGGPDRRRYSHDTQKSK